MASVDLRDVEAVFDQHSTEWHREHYLCSITCHRRFAIRKYIRNQEAADRREDEQLNLDDNI
jgi:hypothetical protein